MSNENQKHQRKTNNEPIRNNPQRRVHLRQKEARREFQLIRLLLLFAPHQLDNSPAEQEPREALSRHPLCAFRTRISTPRVPGFPKGTPAQAQGVAEMSKGKNDGKPGARQVCRATGPTIAASPRARCARMDGCATGQTIEGAPRAAEDGGCQNGQRRKADIRTCNEAWRD